MLCNYTLNTSVRVLDLMHYKCSYIMPVYLLDKKARSNVQLYVCNVFLSQVHIGRMVCAWVFEIALM